MMSTRSLRAGALATALILAAGCGLYANRVEENFGRAQREHVVGMLAHPEAGEQPAAEGLDPGTADQALHRYRAAQERAAGESRAPSIINIGTGAR